MHSRVPPPLFFTRCSPPTLPAPCISWTTNVYDNLNISIQVCNKFDLQPRGSAGEHSAAVEDKFDVSNKQRIGFTEVELVQKMIDGVTQVISLEKAMAAGEKDLAAVKAEIA